MQATTLAPKSKLQDANTVGPGKPWIYGPLLDLVVGCGAWSAPLLAVAMWLTPANTHSWAVGFYLLAIIFNYPHFMATIYRAYHTREDFEKYKVFTLHITMLLIITGILLHASSRLLPWVFTLYICWSPWHYTGQNYGLMMMFVRRSGATVSTAEQRWLRAAFIASYVMLLASFETGGSTDRLILSVGLPTNITLPIRIVCGAAFGVFAFLGFRRLVREKGPSALVAPLTLLLTQFLWFVLPTLIELRSAYQIPQTRYSSGILAILHSAQYIWITSYYQKREARANSAATWRTGAYFATLIAGGIALFIPGPWIVSYVCHYDFTTSFLIFTALVNIHHFILDGAIWKLRDHKISSLLVDPAKASVPSPQTAEVGQFAVALFSSRVFTSPVFRISAAAFLFLWGGVDQVHFALGTDENSIASMQRAAAMNPYDSLLEARIASAEAKSGQRSDAMAALERAVAIDPHNESLQQACARAMIEDGRYEDAYEQYKKMLREFPKNGDALVNYGVLAARLGHPEEAETAWEKAVGLDADQPNAQLYLAQALDAKGQAADATPHWQAFLQLASAHPDDPAVSAQQRIAATIQLGDDEARSGNGASALSEYELAASMAENTGDTRIESAALERRADLQEKQGDAKGAAVSYRLSLAIDQKANDAHDEAFDWFNYGQFLLRRRAPEELAYACFLRAKALLGEGNGHDIEMVKAAVHELGSRLGRKAPETATNLPQLLDRATNLPVNSF